jgi:hypothetical protein
MMGRSFKKTGNKKSSFGVVNFSHTTLAASGVCGLPMKTAHSKNSLFLVVPDKAEVGKVRRN